MPLTALFDRIQRHSFWTIFAIAAAVRITKVLTSIPPPGSGHDELEQVAKSLALHGTFADPYIVATGSTAHVAPGYTALLGLLYAIFGTGLQGEQVKRIASALVSSFQYALLPKIGVAMRLPSWVGTVAGLVSALAPYKSFVETGEASWEQPYLALALILLFLHTLQGWSAHPKPLGSHALTGLYWSLAAYISPVAIPIFAAVQFYELAVFRQMKIVFLTVLVFVVLQIPWIVRNWNQLHGFVVLRSNFGLEFHLSNRPGASALMEDNVAHGFISQFHPSQNIPVALTVRAKGEVAYSREELRAGLAWLRDHPAEFAGLTVERIVKFWLYPSRKWKSTLATTLVTLLGLIGLWRIPSDPAKRLTFLFLTSYPLIYYLIQVDRRYRYPIEWIFIAPAIYVLGHFFARVSGRTARTL